MTTFMVRNTTANRLLPLRDVLAWVPLMVKLGVSEVARSPRGFLTAYRRRGGSVDAHWMTRREGFISRHVAQMVANDEPLYDRRGRPTRRHLALVAWAFSPDPKGLRRAEGRA